MVSGRSSRPWMTSGSGSNGMAERPSSQTMWAFRSPWSSCTGRIGSSASTVRDNPVTVSSGLVQV
jgi:hypothetical protein